MGLSDFDKSMDPKDIQKNSSISTIFAITNQMVGGIIFLLPVMVMQSGIIFSVAVLAIFSFISSHTFKILTLNCQPQEFDFQDIMERIMGPTWKKILNIVMSFYLFLICILYYFLIVTSLYSVIRFTLVHFWKYNQDIYFAQSGELTLEKFSESWLSIAIALPILALLFIKDFGLLVKLSELGIYAIYSYIIFIVYTYCTRIDDIVAYWDNSYIYNFNPGQLLGSVLLGYQIQSTSVPVMKFNKNQTKNERDINITFLLAFCLYLIIGLLGGLSLLSLGEGSIEGKETIIDFFGGQNITPILIEVLYLVHLFSVYPIFWHLTKSRGYEVFIGTNSKPPKWLDPAVNLFYVFLVTFLKNYPIINISELTGLNGAICGFLQVILFPILIDQSICTSPNSFVKSLQKLVNLIGYNKYYQRDKTEIQSQETQIIQNTAPKQIKIQQQYHLQQLYQQHEIQYLPPTKDQIKRKRIAEKKLNLQNPNKYKENKEGEQKNYGQHKYTQETEEDELQQYLALPEIKNFNGQKLGPMLETLSPTKVSKRTSNSNYQQRESLPLSNLTVMEYKHLLASQQKKQLLLTPAINPQKQSKENKDDQGLSQKKNGFSSFYDIKKINSKWLLNLRKKNKKLSKLNFSELEQPKKGMMNIIRQQIQQAEDEKWRQQQKKAQLEQEFQEKQRISESLQQSLQLKHNRYLYEKMSQNNKNSTNLYYQEQNSLLKTNAFFKETGPVQKQKRSVSLIQNNNNNYKNNCNKLGEENSIHNNFNGNFYYNDNSNNINCQVNNGNNYGNDNGKLKYKKSKNFSQINQKQNKKWGRDYQLLPPENANNLNTIFIDEEIYSLSPAESQALHQYLHDQHSILSQQLTDESPLFSNFQQNQIKICKKQQNQSQQPGWWYSISSYNQSNYKPISREGGALIQNGQDAYLYGGISSDVFKDVEHLQINKFGSKLISWKKLEIQNEDRNQSPQFLSGHTINFYKGNLVVFGGEKKLNLANPKYKEVQNDVWLLNLQKKIWQKQEIKSAQIHPRRHHTACIMGKYLVIYGGLDKKQEFLSDISYYNFEKQTWKNLKLARQMPPVAYHTCQAVFHPFRKNQTIKFQQLTDLKLKPFHDIVYEGLYFFGGIDQNNQINGTLKVIEPDQQPLSWTEPNTQGLAPSPRYCHQMVFNDKLNILAIHGGKNDQNLVSEYYLNDTYILQLYNMNWIKIQDFGEKPIPRFNGQMGFFDSKLFIFGGLNGEGYCNSNVQILELDKQIIAEQYLTTTKIKNKQKKLESKIFNHQNHYYESLVDKREIELQIQKAQDEINNLMHPNQIKMKELSLKQIFLEKKFQNLKNQFYNKKNLKYTLQPIKTFMQLDLEYIENAQEKQFYEQFPELKEKILKGEYVNEDEFLNTFYQKKSDLLKEKQKIFLEKKIRSKTLDSGIYFPRDIAPPKSLKQPVNKLMTLKLKTLQNHQNLSNIDQNLKKQEENFKTPKTKIINALSQQQEQQEQQFQYNNNKNNNKNQNNQNLSENQINLNYQQSEQKNSVTFNQTVLSFPLQNTTRTQLLQQKLMQEKRASKNKDKQKYTLDFKQTKEPTNLTEAKVVSFRKQNLDEKQQNMLKDEQNGKINIQDEELVKNLA